jgi:Zn-dependent M28 family amino/carboxypeptidase
MRLLILVALTLQAVPATEPMLESVRRLSTAPSNEARTAALEDMLRARKIPFVVESFTLEKPRGTEPRTEGRNLFATFGRGRELVVVGAHYDAARLPDGSLSSGAVDNAASSAILLRLAQTLMRERLPVRVRIVWFDMEELGLVGSARYVDAHKADRVRVMINLDINAYGDTVIFGPRDAQNTTGRRAVLETCAARDQVCVEYPQMPPSDDRSFTRAGLPSVSLALLPAREAHQLWLMTNAGQESGLAKETVPSILQAIHTPGDAIAKVDEAAMTRMLDFTIALVRRVARQDN